MSSRSWQTYSDIWKLLHGIIVEAAPEFSKLKLQPRMFSLLGQIERHPYPAALAETLFLPRPTVTFLLKQLESLRYIKREGDKADLRRFRFTLTCHGREALERGRGILAATIQQRFEALSAKEAGQFVEMLSKLTASHEGERP